MNNDLNEKVLDSLSGEIFFKSTEEEYKYFYERMDKLSKYESVFLKERGIEKLLTRYIRALSCIDDSYESKAFEDLYKECLVQLGMDDYSIDAEVYNYKKTHVIKDEYLFVSENSKNTKK